MMSRAHASNFYLKIMFEKQEKTMKKQQAIMFYTKLMSRVKTGVC